MQAEGDWLQELEAEEAKRREQDNVNKEQKKMAANAKEEAKVRTKIQDQLLWGLNSGSLAGALIDHEMELMQRIKSNLLIGLQNGSLALSLSGDNEAAKKAKEAAWNAQQAKKKVEEKKAMEEADKKERKEEKVQAPHLNAVAIPMLPFHVPHKSWQKTSKTSKSRTVTVTFSLSCETSVGEEIRLVGNLAALGEWNPINGATMRYHDGHVWATTLKLECPPSASGKVLEFKYVKMFDGKVKGWESCKNRCLGWLWLYAGSSLGCHNVWGDLNFVIIQKEEPNQPNQISPASTARSQREASEAGATHSVTVTFLCMRQTSLGEDIRLVGNVAALGQWDPNDGALMHWTAGHVWMTTVQLDFLYDKPLEFQYVLMSHGKVKNWELRENRCLCLPASGFSVVCHNVWGDLKTVTIPKTPRVKKVPSSGQTVQREKEVKNVEEQKRAKDVMEAFGSEISSLRNLVGA